ncbi:MAG TPA: MATE family efflux transporter [Jatrophihabitans sp.]
MTELPLETDASLVPGGAASLKRLLLLTGSAFFVLAAEPLYLLVDTAVVGHLGARQLAALGVGGVLISVLVTMGSFVEYGTTSRAARWFGAGDTPAALREGVQASWLSLYIGVATVVLGEIFAGPFTVWLAGGHGAEQRAAESWFRISVISLPCLLLVMAGNGWMRGVQRTREPVVIVLVMYVFAAGGSPLFVYGFGMGLQGSAWANLIGEAIGALLFVIALLRASREWQPHPVVMRAQLLMARDLVVRAAGFQGSFLVAASVAARMGTAQIAAHSAGMQLWEFTALVLDSFAIAAQSIVGAALGGGDAAVARHTAWRVARFGLWAGVAFGVIFAAGWIVIPEIFSPSHAVQHQMHLLWPWFVGMMPVAGILFALDGVLIGAGDMAFLRNITAAGALGFIPLSLLALHWHWGIGGVWAGLVLFILIRFAGMYLRARGDRWLVLGARA